MAPLMEIADLAHPKIHLSILNASAPFLRLPVELRLRIYEEVVQEDQPIRPVQVAPRSNKFYHSLDLKNKSLTSSSLSQTCRQVYRDLEAYPVFYKANTFYFIEWHDLVFFLVAISPLRRENIRRIKVGSDWFHHHGKAMKYRKTGPQAHVIAMLGQCKDLREVEITGIIREGGPGSLSTLTDTVKHYADRLSEGAKDSSTQNFLWALNCIKPTLSLNFHDGEVLTIDLTNPEEFPLSINQRLDADRLEHLVEEMNQSVLTIHTRNQREYDRVGSILDKTTSAMYQRAVEAAHIDFPGEDRLAQDKFSSTMGAISTRTRQRCKGGNAINQLGVIQTSRPKYDENGFLLWNVTVENIFWKGDSIECKCRGAPFGEPKTSHQITTESLRAVFGPQLGLNVYQFYKGILNSSGLYRLTGQPSCYFDIEKIPAPKEVLHAMEAYFVEWRDTEMPPEEEVTEWMRPPSMEKWITVGERWEEELMKRQAMRSH